jgi:hypothetical protein
MFHGCKTAKTSFVNAVVLSNFALSFIRPLQLPTAN